MLRKILIFYILSALCLQFEIDSKTSQHLIFAYILTESIIVTKFSSVHSSNLTVNDYYIISHSLINYTWHTADIDSRLINSSFSLHFSSEILSCVCTELLATTIAKWNNTSSILTTRLSKSSIITLFYDFETISSFSTATCARELSFLFCISLFMIDFLVHWA